MKIPIAKPDITENDFNAVRDVLKSGWVVQGPVVREFEKLWSEFTGARNSVAVSSCTTALHLSLAASGTGKGDDVILPAFTWIATANAVEYTGARPVFCDIDLKTFNIDVNSIKEKITEDAKAVIPVHLFGLCADMEPILGLSKQFGLKVVEDAACGFGAYKDGIHSGTKGSFGCFSFHPRKAITTGEGGMIVTADDDEAAKLRSLRDHGAEYMQGQGNKPYLLPEFKMLGYNYRMTDIQAALGVVQMKRADAILEKRRKIAGMYDELLKSVDWLGAPHVPGNYGHGYQSYVCLFMPSDISFEKAESVNAERNKFMQYLADAGILTRPGTHALHIQGYYADKYGLRKEDFPNSFIADRCSIALPVYPGMSDGEFNFTAETILKYRK